MVAKSASGMDPSVLPAFPTAGMSLLERRRLSLSLNCDKLSGLQPLLLRRLDEPPSPSPETPLSSLVQYDIGEALGSGTIAYVRKAVRKHDGKPVALKFIRSEDEEVRMFAKEEYTLMSTMRHDNIASVEGLHEEPTRLIICMELCCCSLQGHVADRGVFQESAAVPMYKHLALGVNFLHQKRIVHRDIKPDNLLLQKTQAQEAYILKISDFNSAKQIGVGPGSSIMLSERGTCFYSAPELRFGRIWNERVDIWASGMCFYFMRRGQAPLDVLHTSHRQMLLSGRLPDMSWSGFSDMARNLIQQCLTVEMRDRPSAMELVLHPLFNDRQHFQRSRSCECFRSAEDFWEADFGQQEFEMHRQISGPSNRGCSTKSRSTASESTQSPMSPLAYWKETRDHSDSLQRMSDMRCDRAMAKAQVDTEPKDHNNQDATDELSPTSRRSRARRRGSAARYFTTHSAYDHTE